MVLILRYFFIRTLTPENNADGIYFRGFYGPICRLPRIIIIRIAANICFGTYFFTRTLSPENNDDGMYLRGFYGAICKLSSIVIIRIAENKCC